MKKEKRSKLMPVLITLILLFSMVTIVTIPTITVGASTIYVGGSGDDNKTTIQEGINAANTGDTIIVSDGIYPEKLVIDKPLTLRSENGSATTTINASTKTGRGAIQIAATVCGVTIGGTDVGFTIIAPDIAEPSKDSQQYGIDIGLNCDRVTIRDNIISGTVQVGVHLWGKGDDAHEDIVIRDNTITSTLTDPEDECYGIVTAPVDSTDVCLFGANCLIDGNDISGFNGCAIYLDSVDGASTTNPIVISNNTLYDNTCHGLVVFGREVSIKDNTIYGNTKNGIAIANNTAPGGSLFTTNIDVEENSIYSNTGWGIRIYSGTATTVTVENNNIYSNTLGGLENIGTGTCPATLNYWGDISGPYHSTTNSHGKGDNVSDNVNYRPWLDVEGNLVYPGVNIWGHATTNLVYHPTNKVSVAINTTGLVASTRYYIYKPIYNNSATTNDPEQFEWDSRLFQDGNEVYLDTDADPSNKIVSFSRAFVLDRAGIWIVDNDDTHDVDTPSFGAFFWVNSSIDYTTTAPSEFGYGTNGTKTITVDAGSTTDTNMWIDLFYNNNMVTNDKGLKFHKLVDPLAVTLGLYGNITKGSGTGAGNYTIVTYKDLDLHKQYAYDWGAWGYNCSHFVTATGYDPAVCGPWDPPERNATNVTFRVEPGTLSTSISNATMYWNFSGEMDISIKDTSGDKIPSTGADRFYYRIVNRNYADVTSYLSITTGDGWLNITNHTGGAGGKWGKDANGTVFGTNGTWRVYIWVDKNSDRTEGNKAWTEEWNATVTFKVTQAPSAQFKWIDDDGALWTDADNDGVIPYIPPVADVPLYIQFQVIGDDHSYFGAGTGASSQARAMENITLSGNALFTGTLDKIPGVTFVDSKTWKVPVIPTMSQDGGTITIKIVWKNCGSLSKTLSIGGTSYITNGTVVTVTPNEFYIGEDQTFTVDVKDADGNSYNYADVYLHYIDEAAVSGGTGTPGDPLDDHMIDHDWYSDDSAYTLGLNITQQRTNQTTAGFTSISAPRNLTVYVIAANAGYGYARIQMKAGKSLKVTAEAAGSPGTSTMMAGYEYSKFYINTTLVDNVNATPATADEGDMEIRIFDESGSDVTNSLGSSWDPNFVGQIDDDYTVALSNVYFTRPGTYKVYGYNNTANSEGNNGTLIVKQVTVTCDKDPLIWKHDKNISATFTVIYEAEAVTGGRLVVDNITWTDGKYNSTWWNCSFDGSTDLGKNTSWELSESEGFTNGTVTMHDITPDNLPAGAAYKNITFWYQPEDSDGNLGVYARAEGVLQVRVPTVTPDKQYIPLGRTTKVDLTVTGRGELLEDIYVRLYGKGVETNGTSGSDGVATFSILPTSTGNISIDVGESGRTVATKITVTSWVIDASVSPSDVDELDTFTVTVLREGTTTKVEGAAVTFKTETKQTDANGQVTFTAPEVTSDRTYTITVSKEGYAPDDDALTITVINVPKLIMSDKTVVAESTFEIAVAKDTGDPVIGATVTFNGATYTTGVGGAVTLTAPATAGDYPITASFGTFQDATATITVTAKPSEGIPGFELLTLIAAIGVAFILLRRRRH